MENVDGATVTVDDFDSICRTCMCDCKNIIQFNVDSTDISGKRISNVLLQYASTQVSR